MIINAFNSTIQVLVYEFGVKLLFFLVLKQTYGCFCTVREKSY